MLLPPLRSDASHTYNYFPIQVPDRDALLDAIRDADLVLLGLAEPGEAFEDYLQRVRERTRGMPPTLHVLAAEEIGYGEVLR